MVRSCILILVFLSVSGCAPISNYIMTDVQSRRECRVHDQPTFLNGGGASFIDQTSGSMVTLQSYEVEGATGEQYQVAKNIWTGQDELKEVKK